MEVITDGVVRFDRFRLIKLLINRINHKFARNNLEKYPQVAIFSFDHIGLSINLDGRYERDSLDLIAKFIEQHIGNSRDSVALDIGANIGNHSLFFSKFFKLVIAFEANPRTFEILQFNTKYVGGKDKILPLCIGLGIKKERRNLFSDEANIGASKIVHESDAKENTDRLISIEVEKADDLILLKEQKISLIKIDIEGHEIFALKGAKNLIVNNKPIILFEQGMDQIDNGSSIVIDYLRELGYEFSVIQNRFNFGNNKVLKIASHICSSILGYKLQLVEKTEFEKRFYDMIVAIPTDVNSNLV